MREHRGEDAPLHIGDILEASHVGVGSLHRAVDGVVSEIEEERFLFRAVEEVHRLVRERIREVARFFDGLVAAHHRVVFVVFRFVGLQVVALDQAAIWRGPAPHGAIRQVLPAQPGGIALADCGLEVAAFVEEAEEVSEASLLRVEGGGAAQMPFADQTRVIPRGAQAIGDGRYADGQADARFQVLAADRVEFETKARLVTAGQQGGARGGAERSRDVAIREACALGDEPVDIRRRDAVAAIAT